MVSVPGFLLRRLYVKGSLRNNNSGFEFELKNMLGSGYARKMLPLVVDGEELAMDKTQFTVGNKTTSFTLVSESNPFTLAMNSVTVIIVSGARLTDGPHNITMGFEVPGIGSLSFDFTDAVTNEE